LYEGEEDRRRLKAMPEVQREQILSERYSAKVRFKFKFKFKN
jgi:hypothetical protein